MVKSRSLWCRPSIASRTGPPTSASSWPAVAEAPAELVDDRSRSGPAPRRPSAGRRSAAAAGAGRRAREAILPGHGPWPGAAGGGAHPSGRARVPYSRRRAPPCVAAACPRGGRGLGGARGGGLATGGGAAAPRRTPPSGRAPGRPRRRAPRRPPTPARSSVTIDTITPSYIPRRGPIRVTGLGHQPRRRPLDATSDATPSSPPTPLRTAAELAEAAPTDPAGDVGGADHRAGHLRHPRPDRPGREPSSSRSGCPAPTARGDRARRLLVRRARPRRGPGRPRRAAPTAGRARSCRWSPAGRGAGRHRAGACRCATACRAPPTAGCADAAGWAARSRPSGALGAAGRLRHRRRRPGRSPGWSTPPLPDAVASLAAGNPPRSIGPDAAGPAPATDTEREHALGRARAAAQRRRPATARPRARAADRRPRTTQAARRLAGRACRRACAARRSSPCRTATSTSPRPPQQRPVALPAGAASAAGTAPAAVGRPGRPTAVGPARAASSTATACA